MSEDLTTTAQDGWQELAAALRVQLLKTAGLTPAMSPEEVGALVGAARELYWLDVWAATFDQEVALRLARVSSSD